MVNWVSPRWLFKWKKYYWRVIGMLLTFGGTGLILDEVFFGKLQYNKILDGYWIQHELWGLTMIIIGLYLVLKYKDQDKNW